MPSLMARAGTAFFEPLAASHSVQVGHQLPSWRVAEASHSSAFSGLSSLVQKPC
jgi:hypothetical protein